MAVVRMEKLLNALKVRTGSIFSRFIEIMADLYTSPGEIGSLSEAGHFFDQVTTYV